MWLRPLGGTMGNRPVLISVSRIMRAWSALIITREGGGLKFVIKLEGEVGGGGRLVGVGVCLEAGWAVFKLVSVFKSTSLVGEC